MSTLSPTVRICKSCQTEKPIETFPLRGDPRYPHHRRWICYECRLAKKRHQYHASDTQKARKAAYRAANRERLKAYFADYDRKRRPPKTTCPRKPRVTREERLAKRRADYAANRAFYLEKKKVYRDENRNRVNASLAVWRERNREVDRENSRKWRRKNPDKQQDQCAIKRARKYNARADSDRTQYRRFVRFMKSEAVIPCYWCGKKPARKDRRIDHIVPLAKGGFDSVVNLCCSCQKCNSAKGAKLPEVFSGQFVIPFQPI